MSGTTEYIFKCENCSCDFITNQILSWCELCLIEWYARKEEIEMSEKIKNLQAWCHWKRKEEEISEDDLYFVEAIETLQKLNELQAEKIKILEDAWCPMTNEDYGALKKCKEIDKQIEALDE